MNKWLFYINVISFISGLKVNSFQGFKKSVMIKENLMEMKEGSG
jgi:hypothetical protein